MSFLSTAGMSLLPWSLVGGAGLGAVKHFAVDKPREEADRRLASETARYSPWTGLKPAPVERANLFSSALQGLGAGAGAAQAFGAFGGMGGGATPPVPGGDAAAPGGGAPMGNPYNALLSRRQAPYMER